MTIDTRETYEGLLKNLEDSSAIYPSKVGQQFYCERKVDLELEFGERETPEKRQGSQVHEKAAEDAVEIEEDEFWASIEKGDRTVVLESAMIGEIDDTVIFGVPDAIVFEDQKPRLIFDRKTTSRPDRIYKNQRVQVWLYAYMLDSLGFHIDETHIAILTHQRRIDLSIAKQLQNIVLHGNQDFEIGKNQPISELEAYVHYFPYGVDEHLDDLKWALEYWQGDRTAKPTKIAAKCKPCEYSDDCPDSLA